MWSVWKKGMMKDEERLAATCTIRKKNRFFIRFSSVKTTWCAGEFYHSWTCVSTILHRNNTITYDWKKLCDRVWPEIQNIRCNFSPHPVPYTVKYISSRPEKIVRMQNKIDSAFCDVNIKRIISEPVLGIGHRKTKLGTSVLSNFILKYIGNEKSLCNMLAFLYSKCHNYVPPNWSLFSLANRVVMR